MNTKTPLETLLASAHEASVCHFPQGVLVTRNSTDKWEACFWTKDFKGASTVKCGATPEAAIEALRAHVIEQLSSKAEAARREHEKYTAAIATAKGASHD